MSDLALINQLTKLFIESRSLGMTEVKEQLIDFLKTQLSFAKIDWVTHIEINQFIEAKQSNRQSLFDSIFKSFDTEKVKSTMYESLKDSSGEVKLKTLSYGSEQTPSNPLQSYLNDFKISTCLGIHVASSNINHLVFIQRGSKDQEYTAEQIALFANLIKLLVAVYDNFFIQSPEGHWLAPQDNILDKTPGYENQAEHLASLSPNLKQSGQFFLETKREVQAKLSTLSESESAVVELLSLGMSSKEIARKLEKSPSTVSKQLTSIYKKCAVSTRQELIATLV